MEKVISPHEFFKDKKARQNLRSWMTSEEGRAVLQELRGIRDNHNDLQAVVLQAQDSAQLAKVVAEQCGYVRALDAVLGLFETFAGEEK